MFVAFMLLKNVWANRGLNNDENIYLIFLSLKEDTKYFATVDWGYVMNIEIPTLVYLSIYFFLSMSIWQENSFMKLVYQDMGFLSLFYWRWKSFLLETKLSLAIIFLNSWYEQMYSINILFKVI